MEQKRGLGLKWAWDVDTAINCLVQIANGGLWHSWKQDRTDTRGIVTERAAEAIREALSGALDDDGVYIDDVVIHQPYDDDEE
jgi:hypothetical protein